MTIEFYIVVDQFYILPTTKCTYKKTLFGFYSIELIWGKWGISIQW